MYQAILNEEPHVKDIAYLTTLAGYVHWKLTGEQVLGIGEASGMFPVDTVKKQFHTEMLDKFDEKIADKKYPWTIRQILPKVLLAGEEAGALTAKGAALLDPSGRLKAGIPMCPPESDAGTGMTATNSVAKCTGNCLLYTSIMKDPIEKDEIYYVHKLNDLLEIGGHYTYYEKNPCMQNYMISARKKNGVCPSETVEDRAAKDFRSMVRNREESQQQKKANRLIYAVSACLLLVVIIMGVTMVNNFDKMKSVQTTLKHLTDTAATDTNSMEIQETSGTVTAVTEETEQKETQQKETQQEEALQDIGQAGGVQEGAEDTQDTEEAKAQSGENGGDGVYVVEEGDTLAIISKKMYGDVDHVEAICKMNGITDGNLIYVGQKLLLP